MSVVAMQETVDPRRFAASLLPIMGVVFVGFLVVCVAMPCFGCTYTADWVCAALVASWLIAYPVTIGGQPQ